MKHDFFTPQVVKGADVYIYRWIFHNWVDEQSIKILQAAIPALKSGARILINDGCLPEPGSRHRCEEKASRYVVLSVLLWIPMREY